MKKWYSIHLSIIALLFLLFNTSLFSQEPELQEAPLQESILDVGWRFQKTVNLYFESGVSIKYSHKNLSADKLYFGFDYVTSRLGSATNSNAIVQDQFLFSGSWYFRPKKTFRPLLRLNVGYFVASYKEEMFDVLPNSSFLLSPEIGASFETKLPLKFVINMGYNIITGNGITGPGTLYPLYFQTTVSWNILN